MKAYQVRELGGPGVVGEAPIPVPGEGEVLVRIGAAAINFIDTVVVAGYLKDFMEHRLPLIPGVDGVGTVEAVGTGVSGLAVGDAVMGLTGKKYFGEGTFAEHATMSEATLVRRPAAIDEVSAAAILLPGVTAAVAVDATDPEPGSTVLVVGASGGVGGFATQLAARRGARVLAVTSGANADYVRSLGATVVIDYTAGDVEAQVRAAAPDGVDAIVDTVSDPDGLAKLSELVRSGGRIATTRGQIDTEGLAARSITGVAVNSDPSRLAAIVALAGSGELRIPEVRVLPLDQAGEALAEQAGRHVRGRLVLKVG